MLASLLPGLRELRTPLATGYVWLVAGWIAIASHVPDRGEDPLVDSLYDLSDTASAIGLGVAASFAAYLIGALSLAFCSAPPRHPFENAQREIGRVRISTLSRNTSAAISQLARNARIRLDPLIALSGTDFDELVAAERRAQAAPSAWRRRFWRHRRPRSLRGVMLTSDSPPPDPAGDREALLRRIVIDDLELVPTRLLGTDVDLYSLVDRHRAEVEFRLGVIPPLLALAAALAFRVDSGLVAAAVVIIGVGAASGLYRDAVLRERDANDLLTDALALDRVRAPTLERLEARAAAGATESPAEALTGEAAATAQALRDAIEYTEELDSRPSAYPVARDALAHAERRLDQLKDGELRDVIPHGLAVVDALRPWVDWFADPSRGSPPDRDAVIAEATERQREFRDAALAARRRLVAAEEFRAGPTPTPAPEPSE